MKFANVASAVDRIKRAISARFDGPGSRSASVGEVRAQAAAASRGRGRILSHRALAARVYLLALLCACMVLPYSRINVGGAVIDLTFVLAAIALLVAYATYTALLRRAFRRHSYGWYARNHAAHLLPDGRISCCHCQSRRIGHHELHGVGYFAQMCMECGQTLFFRPERRKRRRGRRSDAATTDGTTGRRAREPTA